jgi:hypothetical protein
MLRDAKFASEKVQKEYNQLNEKVQKLHHDLEEQIHTNTQLLADNSQKQVREVHTCMTECKSQHTHTRDKARPSSWHGSYWL